MNSESDQILALIPAYNEVLRVGQVVSAARNFLPVMVVDDGSSDDTAQAAEAAGALVLSQSSNQGKGAALRAGFSWALKGAYTAVLTFWMRTDSMMLLRSQILLITFKPTGAT